MRNHFLQRKDIMYQESMDSSVSIFKRVQEYKTVGNRRCMDDRRNSSRFHPLMGFNQTCHQAGKVARLWTDEVYNLLLVSDRLPDVILAVPVIALFESRVNNPVLKLDQPFLLTEVLFFGKPQGSNKFFSSGDIGLNVLNFKGRLCLVFLEVAQRPAKKLRWICGDNILTSFAQIGGVRFGKPLCSPAFT